MCYRKGEQDELAQGWKAESWLLSHFWRYHESSWCVKKKEDYFWNYVRSLRIQVLLFPRLKSVLTTNPSLNNKTSIPENCWSPRKINLLYKISWGIRHKLLEHKLKFYLQSVASDLSGYGGCRGGIISVRNYLWGILREELRLWLMVLERKLRPGLRSNQVVFLLWKGLSQVGSCKRWAIGHSGSTLKDTSIQEENAGDRDEEKKNNEGLGSRCLWRSLWGW